KVGRRHPCRCSLLSRTRIVAGMSYLDKAARQTLGDYVTPINVTLTKAGLMMMTQCLALELAPKIRVNTIVPGFVLTDETERRFNLADPQVRQARVEAVPMNRLGTPDDIANAVMMLLADEAGFITGQKLFVDGGQNMW
ncbi:MAG TPA: SDR family oxidoreductase, partial [Candidatus Limnocylindrales bacterium]